MSCLGCVVLAGSRSVGAGRGETVRCRIVERVRIAPARRSALLQLESRSRCHRNALRSWWCGTLPMTIGSGDRRGDGGVPRLG